MATTWYDPNSGSGLSNSPVETMFGGGPSSSFGGQGPAGIMKAASMPTAAEYYFSPPSQPSSSMPQMGGGGPTVPEGWNPHRPIRVAPGSNVNVGNAVSVGEGPLWQRYENILSNPELASADPAFQYMQKMGEQALARSAGARRQRFAGKTMLDFQEQGQGLAAQNLRQILPELRMGAEREYGMMENEARAKSQTAQLKAMAADPYGHARNLSLKYPSLNAFMSSPEYANAARLGRSDQAVQLYMSGQTLNQQMGLG